MMKTFFFFFSCRIAITNKQINVHVEKLSPKNATKQVCWKTHHKSTTKHVCGKSPHAKPHKICGIQNWWSFTLDLAKFGYRPGLKVFKKLLWILHIFGYNARTQIEKSRGFYFIFIMVKMWQLEENQTHTHTHLFSHFEKKEKPIG